jgi:hypothetical protein
MCKKILLYDYLLIFDYFVYHSVISSTSFKLSTTTVEDSTLTSSSISKETTTMIPTVVSKSISSTVDLVETSEHTNSLSTKIICKQTLFYDYLLILSYIVILTVTPSASSKLSTTTTTVISTLPSKTIVSSSMPSTVDLLETSEHINSLSTKIICKQTLFYDYLLILSYIVILTVTPSASSKLSTTTTTVISTLPSKTIVSSSMPSTVDLLETSEHINSLSTKIICKQTLFYDYLLILYYIVILTVTPSASSKLSTTTTTVISTLPSKTIVSSSMPSTVDLLETSEHINSLSTQIICKQILFYDYLLILYYIVFLTVVPSASSKLSTTTTMTSTVLSTSMSSTVDLVETSEHTNSLSTKIICKQILFYDYLLILSYSNSFSIF